MMISLHTVNNSGEKERSIVDRKRRARVFSPIYGTRTDGWQKVTSNPTSRLCKDVNFIQVKDNQGEACCANPP